MKRRYAFFIILFLLMFQQLFFFKVKASTSEIIYLYNDEYKISENTIVEIKNNQVNIKKINLDKLDNMKYFYLYQEVYEIPYDEFKAPIVLSGDNYYLGDEINENIDGIINNASKSIKSIANVEIQMIVYFMNDFCGECGGTKPYIHDLEESGVKVVWVNTVDNDNKQFLLNYGEVYKVKKPTVPIVFAGDKYYHTRDDIIENIDNIILNSSKPLLDVEFKELDMEKYQGLLGYLFVIIGGLIDGVNPCAMAILVLFIGLLIGTNAKKSTLINISIAYILGLFITYFALGLFLMEFITSIEPYIKNLSTYINIFIIVFSLFFFFFNLYDFVVTKNKEYKKVKNQLPKRIQKFNKKIINFFTNKINDKNIFIVYIFSFTLAVIITFTEFLCTGQVYLPIILIIKETSGFEGTIKLLIYNVMFVVPLIILATFAIKAKSAMEASNAIREKLHIIKLITSILFLVIAIYYILIVAGVI